MENDKKAAEAVIVSMLLAAVITFCAIAVYVAAVQHHEQNMRNVAECPYFAGTKFADIPGRCASYFMESE